LTGELIDTDRASSTPLTSSLPSALTQRPFFTSDAEPVPVASYVVDDVVFTVTAVSDPKLDFTMKDDPLSVLMVPNAPPKPPPNRPRNDPELPGKPDDVGKARGVAPSPKPPAGGVKLPPPGNPPCLPLGCWQPDVLVTVTDVAVTLVGRLGVAPGVGRLEPAAPVPVEDTITQSPFASDERVVDAVEVKRVVELKSMVCGPLVCWTAALDALAASTSPDTEVKAAADVPFVPVPVCEDTDDAADPPPHAVRTTARPTPPAAYVTRRAVRRELGADTVTPVMRAARSTGLLGTQGVDRREPRGTRCWIDPEAESEGDRDDDRSGRC
jgi:hypothetical protein